MVSLLDSAVFQNVWGVGAVALAFVVGVLLFVDWRRQMVLRRWYDCPVEDSPGLLVLAVLFWPFVIPLVLVIALFVLLFEYVLLPTGRRLVDATDRAILRAEGVKTAEPPHKTLLRVPSGDGEEA